MPSRRYVYKANNQVKGNRPVDVGYELSTVGLSRKENIYGMSTSAWNLPLSMRLVPWGENKNSFTARQVNDLLENEDLPLFNSLVVNALDSNYSSPEYIADTYKNKNLVNIIRLASNRNVWKKLGKEESDLKRSKNKDRRGAPSIYGEKYKLNEQVDWELNPDYEQSFGIKLARGKKCVVEVRVWGEMLLRTKRKKKMKDKPFRLVQIQLLDARTQAPLFKNCMWLGVWGEARMELTGEEIFWCYRNRYDIEHFFRFGKQKLLLDKFQTPEEEHLENWLEVVNLSYWMLWVAKDESNHCCRKWGQYEKSLKQRVKYALSVSPSQVQMQLENIILRFDQTPFMPRPTKKGNGRYSGQTMEKRLKYPVLKKKNIPKKRKVNVL